MDGSKKTAIVFFSKNGSTRLASKLLGERCGREGAFAGIIELEEKRKGGVLRAIMKKGSKLKGEPWLDIAGANKVYLMLPIWAGNGVPAMNTFIKNAGFAGKAVCVITVQADPEFKGSREVHKYIGDIVIAKGGTLVSSYALLGAGIGQCASKSAMKEQIERIALI
jgi:hypothetical protein